MPTHADNPSKIGLGQPVLPLVQKSIVQSHQYSLFTIKLDFPIS